MPWQPLPRIAFAVATFPFAASGPADLPLELGDELYIIEETPDGNWLRGYLVAPPSLLAGLTSVKGQTLEARVFSGIFPRSCVEVREVLGESDDTEDLNDATSDDAAAAGDVQLGSDSGKSGLTPTATEKPKLKDGHKSLGSSRGSKGSRIEIKGRKPLGELPNGTQGRLSIPVKRDPDAPRPAAPVPMLKIGDETPTSAAEPLVDEIASCLREWHSTNLHGLLLSRQYPRLEKLSQLIQTLNLSRQQFLHNVLTRHEYDKLREKTVWDLVRVNKLCGGEVIVRDPADRGRVLTGDDSVVDVTKLQSVMSVLDEPPVPTVEPTALHHLLVDVKGFAGASAEETSLVVYLVAKPVGGQPAALTECFIIDIPPGGTIGSLAKSGQTRTIFADLSAQDIGDVASAETELYLVVKVRSSQQVIPSGKPDSRSGIKSQGGGYSKDPTKPPSASGNKPSRRSLMWGSKSGRSAFSRGNATPKLDSLTEQPEGRPPTQDESQDSAAPPSTAGSRQRGSFDGGSGFHMAERTVGIGVLKLNAVMKQDEDVEQVVSIWSPSPTLPTEKQGLHEEWDTLIRDLMDSKSGHYEKSRRTERVQVHLKSFNHPDVDALVKMTPTLLAGIRKTNKMGFSGAPTKARSDIYVTLDTAALSKQNLLSRYAGNPAILSGSVHGNNLQVTLEVRRTGGEKIPNCIFSSSNTEGITTWKSVAVERGEQWSQTVRLAVPPEDVFTSHIVMFLSDMPNAPFAVAHMPLWNQEAFVRDGAHALLLYKTDEFTSTAQAGPTGKGGYLSLQWSARGNDEHSSEVTGPLALLRVDTYLCSTRFSQDRIVLGLLKWKEAPKEDIPMLLKHLIFVPEIEVVKLLSDVLDGLFGVLVEHSGNDEYEDLVFTALVRVLGIVHDRRFNLGPLVDHYAENRFNYPFATACLVRSFTRLLEKPTEAQTSRKLRSTFKVVRHILKFITHARGQQKAKEAGIGITTSHSTPGFTRELRNIFKALDSMMRSNAPVLVGSQTLAVQHFHTWLPELTGLLTTEEILHIAIDFLDSCSLVKGKLVLYKLVLIINYSKLDIFSHPEQKSALTANTVRWIAPHWGHNEDVTDSWKEQVRLCCSILAGQIDNLGPEIPDYLPKIIDSYLSIVATSSKPRSRLSLLFPTSYPFPSKPIAEESTFDEALVELSAILSAVSNSSSGMQLELTEGDLTALLENTLRVHMSILMGEAFPHEWLSVYIYHHKSTMRTLQYLSSILLESFLPHPDEAENFNTELWKMFFTTMLKLVGSPSLALETFPEQKRRAVWKIAGDVREHGAELLRRTWEAIGWETSSDERARYGLSKMGGYQVQYVPTLVGPIVELCLSVHEGLRRMAVEVLQTMIVSEWTLSEDLSVIQTEMIDCLDHYFKSKPLTESILQKLFVNEVLERFAPLSSVPDEPLYAGIRDLMATVDEFLDLLVAVHSSDNTSEASHLINRLRLMEFLRDMQKEEIFIRYVHQLAILQGEARNHCEAGLALRLHADLYDWDPTKQVTALDDPEFPIQTSFERKERIYFDMIKHFEEGEAWTSALAAYQELRIQYESNVFDFAKLARTERAIATIYETISKSDKLVPKYFKVVYKGLGFPSSLRDKEFVYEGSPTERASAFTDRMQEQYPSAQIVTGGDVDDVEGQFLVVSAITPHRDLSHQVFQRARVAQVIRDYLVSAHPQSFSVSSKRSTSGPVQEHFAEKMVCTTADPFPTILRRSEIVHTEEIKLSARQTGLERIVRKTQEMTVIEKRITEGDEENAQLLVDAVSVSVNPDSENSVACYRQLLPSRAEPEDDEDDVLQEEEVEPELDPEDNAIKMALVDHAIMIKRCLATFSRSTNEILNERHEELQRYFESTFAPEIALFAPQQPSRESANASPTYRRSSPSTEQVSPQPQSIAGAMTNGVAVEEVSTVQPVAIRQGRGTRLSFLGGRKKESPVLQQTPSDPQTTPEAEDTVSHRSRSFSKTQDNVTITSNANRRSSFFRAPSSDIPRVLGSNDATSEWVTDSGGRRSSDAGTNLTEKEREYKDERPVDALGIVKRGSVRKRLSMLKLGKKSAKGNGTMVSVHEE
ncbi:SH3 domain-containing protein [Colletotrichum paranaense]|uniref:SH3 domain-containing protein n=1 Tax=Colletotrichum paranaense TaxID=1914294 RepID=A0ABQ9SZ63_9PEZI|nr:SH3 domain-containing protein [Colletotrichum paranaense]KAK1544818.1 SH3 domain-containing protein [Colletotrichum paranaense]